VTFAAYVLWDAARQVGMDGRLEIYTLGGVRILRGGEAIAGLSQRKAEALLVYLAITPRFQPGEVLADLFQTFKNAIILISIYPFCCFSTAGVE
jgi:hypothetical protein